MNRSRSVRILSAATLILAAGAPALAQHALDRNLQIGSGGINPARPDLAAELRFRNAIVTGNAPGGLSFRGDVGYRAPGDFTGSLGSNDTFAFRRDTVYSGMGGMGIRGTDALQYQFALTTGMAPPAGFLGTPTAVPRSGAGPTAGLMRSDPAVIRAEGTTPVVPPRWSPGDSAADVGGLSLAAMRAPSAFVTARTFQPTVLGTTMGADGVPLGITASVLRGVAYGPVTAGRDLEGTAVPTPAELAGLRVPSAGDPLEQRLDMGAGAISPRRGPYEEMLERMRPREVEPVQPGVPEDPTAVGRPGEAARLGQTDWRNRLTDLRVQLQQPTLHDSQRIAQGIDERLDPRARETTTGPAEARDRLREFSPETVDMLRRAGQVDVLAPPDVDNYGVHMEAAQRYLAAGRFFDAEERFTAALSARRGDPMAAIGRVHAALGAGMFLSAAINLRELLITNPEVAGARYGRELLPGPQRLEQIKERLAELITARPAQSRENGLLLAYLGFQMRDAAAMNRGLAAMEAPPPQGQPLSPADEQMVRLATLLRQVWEEAEQER
jgi:hypothetical protein